MSIWSKINPMKVLGGIGNFVDESFLSKEEVQKAIVEHAKTTLQETTPRSITRRYIAVSVVGVFLFLILLCVGVYPWFPEYAAFVFSAIKDLLFAIVITIVIFYFGGYYGGKLLKSKEK